MKKGDRVRLIQPLQLGDRYFEKGTVEKVSKPYLKLKAREATVLFDDACRMPVYLDELEPL